MTPSKNDTQEIEFCQEFQTMLHEKVRLAVRYTLITVLEEEVEAFIGAGRYERSDQRRDQRNGTYPPQPGHQRGPDPGLAGATHAKGFEPRCSTAISVVGQSWTGASARCS